MDANVVIREATEADGPVLCDLERRSPLMTGDGAKVIIDRGNDYFAASRLMGDPTVLVAEVDGVPAGVYCGVRHIARLGGVDHPVLYVHHARIPPEYQRHGLGRAFSARLNELYKGHVDTMYWYISPANAISQGFARNSRNKWGFGPIWAAFDTVTLAAEIAGRSATPADAGRIVALLNAFHEGAEMFVPYTVETFTARLSRDPKQYGWDHVWLTDNAVLGVWPEGQSIVTRFIDPQGNETRTRGAAALDYAFAPGAEAEFESLLRGWCMWLRRSAIGELTAFTSPATRGERLIRQLATSVSAFDFWTPSIPEPAGAPSHGLYVDHLYF